MRLDKLLGNLKYGSRSDIKDAVKDGRVTVDGIVISDPGLDVNPETSMIAFDGEPVFYRKWVYLMMNKPKGVVSANEDSIHPTAVGLLQHPYDRFDVSICGRLDLDTEGLLVLTNDGDVLHRIISPKAEVFKTYEVELKSPLHDYSQLETGVRIKDGKEQYYTTLPAQVEPTGERTCRIRISEGKFHQVKRMIEAIGNEVVGLRRTAIGGLTLDPTLAPGAYREMDYEEVLRAIG
ncbi:MAG: pseudouridine synthase [Bacillota bacterium]|nr:pseudouridine synthase [Bacillota bacterium]